MKLRRATRAKGVRKTSEATLARRYRDLLKLRDKIRKAETICARRRSNRTTPIADERLFSESE
jgi:hypothetical protein